MREILRGDMAGLVSDFLLSESRSIPRFRRTEFLVSRNPSKGLKKKINIKKEGELTLTCTLMLLVTHCFVKILWHVSTSSDMKI